MRGNNFDELERQAEKFAEKLVKHRRIQEVNTNERLSYYERKTEEYVLRFDQDRMSLGGADMYRMVSALDDVAKPQSASLFVDVDNRRFGVYLKKGDSDRFSKFDLENTSLIS